CEDLVLLKRRMLIEKGWPVGALLITVVRQSSGEGHAVLTVLTDRGDLVLDNLDPHIVVWSQTDYHFVKRQSEFDSGQWVSVDDGRAPEVGSLNHWASTRRNELGPGRAPPPVPKIRPNRAGPPPRGRLTLFWGW